MKKYLILLLLFAGCRSVPQEYENRPIDYQKLLILHNQNRSDPLVKDEILNKYAKNHAKWMASNRNLSHSDLEFLQNSRWHIAGENIACGQSTEEQVVRDWMNSPGHRRNIQNSNFKFVGFGVMRAQNGVLYWCVVFAG